MRQNAGGKRSHGCGRGAGNEREDHCSQWHSLVFPACFCFSPVQFSFSRFVHFIFSCFQGFRNRQQEANAWESRKHCLLLWICYIISSLLQPLSSSCRAMLLLLLLNSFVVCIVSVSEVSPSSRLPSSACSSLYNYSGGPLPFSNWTALWFSNKWV